MIKLTVGNSTCRLEGLSRTKFDEIRTALSYIEATCNRFGFQNVKRHLMDRKGTFPTGLLTLVRKSLSTTPHEVTDTRVKPTAKPGMFKLRME